MSFLRLFAFVLRLRFVNRYSGKPGKWIGLILGILYVVSQAVMAIYILDFSDNSWASRQVIVGIINFVLMFLLIAVHFFPTYQATSMPIWSFHPAKQWQRGLFALVCDEFTLAPGLAALFVSLLLFSPHYGPNDFLFSALALVVIFMSERSVRLILDYRFRHKLAYFVVAVALLLAPFAVFYRMIERGEYLWLPMTVSAIFAVLLQLFLSLRSAGCSQAGVLKSERLTIGMGTQIRSIGFQLSLLNFRVPLMRRAFFLFFLGKVSPLFFFAYLMEKSEQIQYVQFMLFWVAAPMVPFNYLLNNLFGHSVALWDSVRLHSVRKHGLLWVYRQVMLLPLMIDAVFSFIVIGVTGLLDFWFLFFYFGLLPGFIAIGYLGSLLRARHVEPVSIWTCLKNPVSPLISGLTTILAALFAFTLYTSHASLVILVLLSVAFFVVTINLRPSFWRTAGHSTYVALHGLV